MLTLWYIILGWKEYNKPFRKADQPPKPVDSVKKPDLIPQKKDVVPTPVQDNNKSEPSKSIPIDPKPPSRQSESSFFPSKTTEVPEISEKKLPTPRTPDLPKAPEIPKTPEPPKLVPRTPETPKTPEVPKVEPPKIPPRTPESPKAPDFKLAPEIPKKVEIPKTPEPPKLTPKTSQSFKPEAPKDPEGTPNMMPSRRPESVMPDFPPSTVNPSPGQSEFPIPPYLPGAPQSRPLSKDDELFGMSNPFSSPSPNKPMANLRDLSYAKGEFPGDVATKVQDNLSKIPKYMEQSVISNPDSLESEEDDEDF